MINEIKRGEHITDINEIKALEVQILRKFDEFCSQHNLKYCLTGGSLLGAVRHRGIIPWDDDIDIGMFRPDYDRLLELASDMPKDCRLFSIEKGDRSARLYGRVCDMGYVSIDKYYDQTLSNYFGIDVFPLEAVPSDEAEYAKFSRKIRLLRRMFIFSNSALFKGNGFAKAFILKPIPIIICKIIGSKRIFRMFRNLINKINYDDAQYIALLTGQYTENEQYPKDKYYKLLRLDFEGLKLPALESYDEYLTRLYGDYMQLPDETHRQPHHSFDLYKVND